MKTDNTRLFPQVQNDFERRGFKGDFTTFPLTSILRLAAAGALVALTVASIPACTDESVEELRQVGPAESIFAECQQFKRAKTRRACRARLSREVQTDIAGK